MFSLSIETSLKDLEAALSFPFRETRLNDSTSTTGFESTVAPFTSENFIPAAEEEAWIDLTAESLPTEDQKLRSRLGRRFMSTFQWAQEQTRRTGNSLRGVRLTVPSWSQKGTTNASTSSATTPSTTDSSTKAGTSNAGGDGNSKVWLDSASNGVALNLAAWTAELSGLVYLANMEARIPPTTNILTQMIMFESCKVKSRRRRRDQVCKPPFILPSILLSVFRA